MRDRMTRNRKADDELGIDDSALAEIKLDQNARANANWPVSESVGQDTMQMTASQRKMVAKRLLKLASLLVES